MSVIISIVLALVICDSVRVEKWESDVKTNRPRKVQRHDHILSALQANPALRVTQLAVDLGVSTETIRRDLAELDERGRISRTYGGAVSAGSRFEPALAERLTLNINERRAIAARAVELFANEEALLLGGGATMLIFARALRDIRHRLTVMTPAYPVAVELAANPLIEVMMLPGLFEPTEGIVCGSETIRTIERYRPPVAIIGASGISAGGVSEALLSAAEVYSAMLSSASQGVVLADHDKFERRALVMLSAWRPSLTLVTDKAPPAPITQSLHSCGTRLEIVGNRPVAESG